MSAELRNSLWNALLNHVWLKPHFTHTSPGLTSNIRPFSADKIRN